MVVTGSEDGTLALAALSCAREKGKALASSGTLRGHGVSVTSLAVSTEYHAALWAVSGGADGRCKVWDCDAGVCVFSAHAQRAGKVAAVALIEPWASASATGTGGRGTGEDGGLGGGETSDFFAVSAILLSLSGKARAQCILAME